MNYAPSLNIREAVIADIPTLLDFEQRVVIAERPCDKTLKPAGVKYYDLDFLITSDSARLLVATVEDQIVATGYAKILEAKPHYIYTHYTYLGFMCTLPEYRGMGINKMIIEALVHWSHSKDISEIRLEVYAENAGALKAYKKAGFKNIMIEMKLDK
jgi:ribosomal protein S18 acetylase RimI-like enzyme